MSFGIYYGNNVASFHGASLSDILDPTVERKLPDENEISRPLRAILINLIEQWLHAYPIYRRVKNQLNPKLLSVWLQTSQNI